MPRSEHRSRIDWLGWFALAWAVFFGLLYAEMIVRSRAPGLRAAIQRAFHK